MKERPILFSAPMIPPIIDGRKTQTRRLVQHEHIAEADIFSAAPVDLAGRWEFGVAGEGGVFAHGDFLRCPFGVPGDRLWVREEHYRFGHWERVTGAKRRTRTGRQRWRFVADLDEVRFDAPTEFRKGRHHKDPATPAWHKRLARFMPRALSRMSLEVSEVRVQRLREISEDDARAEGAAHRIAPGGDLHGAFAHVPGPIGYVAHFHDLWNSLNGKRAPWSSNPFVWAITFRKASS